MSARIKLGNPKVRARVDLGRSRIAKVLKTYAVAHLKTLEQKISDAGPGPMRVDPALLSAALRQMQAEGVVRRLEAAGTTWYQLARTSDDEVRGRLDALTAVWNQITDHRFRVRLGQTLEVAIYKGLIAAPYASVGAFKDLDAHDDRTPYSKEEPPTIIGGRRAKGPLDFLALAAGDIAGIEAKNVREWFYPDNTTDLPDFLLKCVDLNIVPVLIARRVSYVAFSEVLHPCGVLVHEMYNQRYPQTAAALAAQAADKQLLGFHDVRASNDPDPRLLRFLHNTLPAQIGKARAAFDRHKDLLQAWASHRMTYKDFNTELRIRMGIYSSAEQAFPHQDE